MKGLHKGEEFPFSCKDLSEAMSGPTPMSPSTSPAGVVSSSGALDAGTNPVPSMSGPTGPPVTYGPVRPIGASGPGVDPLQGSGDPWRHGQQENPGLSFAPVSSATVFPLSPDGSGNTSGTWQTGQSATASTPASTATFGMPPGFLDVCSIQHGPSGLADDETADAFDSEYDGLYDEVSTEHGTTNAWSTSTSKQWTGCIFRKCTF